VGPLADALRAARRRGDRVVVPYLMVDRARAPRLAATVAALEDAGAGALELGFPFSDPIADGPTLEAAADRALRHGTSWSDLLEQARHASRTLPTAVMTYANPVWARGLPNATRELRGAGVTGLIVPDLSLEETAPWRSAAEPNGLALVLLAAPSADPARTGRIARRSRGFLYLVSRFGTTGAMRGPGSAAALRPLVAAAHRAAPELPVLVGFGVRDAASARDAVSSGADGVVVGSALEEHLAANGSPRAAGDWLRPIVRAVGARA
jgi:tryptophan synthase alpha chain